MSNNAFNYVYLCISEMNNGNDKMNEREELGIFYYYMVPSTNCEVV